jgi:ribosome recycling factor
MCDNILNDILNNATNKMKDTIDAFKSELSRVRTGRASTSLVDHIKVDYYGSPTQMNQIANVTVPEPRTILIQPWDASVIAAVEKAIQQSELGITPSNDGKMIRITMPLLTEERRKDLVKYIHKMAEDFRVSVRNARKDINARIKAEEKENKLPEDEVKKMLSKVQDATDKYISEIKKILDDKEKEILDF